MSADATDLAQLWMETTCHAALPRRNQRLRFTGAPVVIREPRRSWRDNLPARVRYAMRELLPHDDKVIEGVRVIRDSELHENGGNLYYWIAGSRVKDFESACERVIRLVNERGEHDGTR